SPTVVILNGGRMDSIVGTVDILKREFKEPLTLLLTINGPLSSPLFPYTTLFRSCFHDRRSSRLRRCRSQPNRRHESLFADGWAADRKSTRLNSSHVKISYAVYCLKKKVILSKRS